MQLIVWACSQTDSPTKKFSDINSPYLGQELPGIVPGVFAPGIISTGLEEVLCTFMPGGDEIIFNIIYTKPHKPGLCAVLVRSYLEEGGWSQPEVMNFVGDKYMYMYPFISYDGTELYFQSDMPVNNLELKDRYNIWRCKRIDGKWSDPEPLPQPINGRGDVSGPSMSENGEFYFTLMSGNAAVDGIYMSHYRNGTFSDPERLPESVNVKEGSFDGVISPDGSYYIVNIYGKDDSFGETDLYVSFREGEAIWTPVINLGSEVNTKLNEGSARISADGKFIFFTGVLGSQNFYTEFPTYNDILYTRTRPLYGNSDIYWVSSEILQGLIPMKN